MRPSALRSKAAMLAVVLGTALSAGPAPAAATGNRRGPRLHGRRGADSPRQHDARDPRHARVAVPNWHD